MSEAVTTVETVHLDGADFFEAKAKLHDGEVLDVAQREMDKVRSFGHQVREVASDWTGREGRGCRALHYEVTVRLEGTDRDYVWQHSFLTPERTAPVPVAAPDEENV